MCFSAGASFTGGAVLTAIGVASLRKVSDPKQKLFAEIPLLFAFQQFAEGMVWLTLKSGGYHDIQMTAAYIFIIMALVVWPVILPLAVLKMEEIKVRRKIIKALLGSGVILSLYYTTCLVLYNVYPAINGFHIQYINDFPVKFGMVAFGVYIIATMGPLFISSIRGMNLFGILIMFSCLVTGIFYKEYLTSVWCFFAALISIVIYRIVSLSQEEADQAAIKLMKILSDYNPWKRKFRE